MIGVVVFREQIVALVVTATVTIPLNPFREVKVIVALCAVFTFRMKPVEFASMLMPAYEPGEIKAETVVEFAMTPLVPVANPIVAV